MKRDGFTAAALRWLVGITVGCLMIVWPFAARFSRSIEKYCAWILAIEQCYAAETQETEPLVISVSATEAAAAETHAISDEVLALNSRIQTNEASGIVDITTLTSLTAAEVRSKIEAYSMPSCEYLDGVVPAEGMIDAIMMRRNLSALTDPVTLQYGLLVKNTAVRTYPTWQKLATSAQEDAFDYFQETMFNIGEGVVILHQTADQVWSFVQGRNDCGWVETSCIAFCSQSEMNSYSNSSSFVVVINHQVLMAGNQELRMGTRLPMIASSESTVTVCIPKRNDNGSFYESQMSLNRNGISIGYLTYTDEELTKQAMSLLGEQYGWGDSGGFMDCSSTVGAIYKCFGIWIPRNTSQMMYAGSGVNDISWMTVEEKKSFIQNLPVGSLLLMSGHVVMYMGLQNGQYQILHNVSAYSVDAEEIQRPLKCVMTPYDVYSPAGVNYLELYQYAITFSN